MSRDKASTKPWRSTIQKSKLQEGIRKAGAFRPRHPGCRRRRTHLFALPGSRALRHRQGLLTLGTPCQWYRKGGTLLRSIRRAPKCIFHVTGASKTDRLAEVISLAVGKTSDIETRRLPAAYAMRIAQKAEIFTDIKLPTSRKRGLSSHLLSGILNPSLLWLSVLPILLAESEGFGLWGLTPHLCAAGLLILFAVIQSLFRINYRSLYAHLPLLLLIPFHKVILVRLMEGMMSLSGNYSTPLLFGLIVVASIWGISSIRTCELSKHPTCRELLFSHRLMGAVAALYLPLYIVLSGHTWMDGVLPALLIVSVWATHTLRILGRARRRARTTIPTCIESRQEVRVAIIRGQEVWLTPNPCTDREECRDYDLPFSTFIRSGEDRQTAWIVSKNVCRKGITQSFCFVTTPMTTTVAMSSTSTSSISAPSVLLPK